MLEIGQCSDDEGLNNGDGGFGNGGPSLGR